jgi:hypothetical protein
MVCSVLASAGGHEREVSRLATAVVGDSCGWRYLGSLSSRFLVEWGVGRKGVGEGWGMEGMNGLVIAHVVEQGGEVDDAQVEGGLEGRVGVSVDVVRHGYNALDVVPAVRRVVVFHVIFYVGRDGLHEGVVLEGPHGSGGRWRHGGACSEENSKVSLLWFTGVRTHGQR